MSFLLINFVGDNARTCTYRNGRMGWVFWPGIWIRFFHDGKGKVVDFRIAYFSYIEPFFLCWAVLYYFRQLLEKESSNFLPQPPPPPPPGVRTYPYPFHFRPIIMRFSPMFLCQFAIAPNVAAHHHNLSISHPHSHKSSTGYVCTISSADGEHNLLN